MDAHEILSGQNGVAIALDAMAQLVLDCDMASNGECPGTNGTLSEEQEKAYGCSDDYCMGDHEYDKAVECFVRRYIDEAQARAGGANQAEDFNGSAVVGRQRALGAIESALMLLGDEMGSEDDPVTEVRETMAELGFAKDYIDRQTGIANGLAFMYRGLGRMINAMLEFEGDCADERAVLGIKAAEAAEALDGLLAHTQNIDRAFSETA